ncbi:MAG: amino acid permease, partial [Bacteroidia bacterium]|nr:amino acid permease [Bacteroidia bacterium]
MQSESNQKLGLFSATALVIANIIGTGIFTTTGFQAYFMKSPFAIMVIWFVGGILALCGALTYGELASAMPDSGGEYRYLSRIYHPVVGFCSGFISLFAGFSAPVAASATAFGFYFSKVIPSIPPTWAAASLVIFVTILHSRDLKTGSRFQDFFTVLKASLIIGFIIAGFWLGIDTGTKLDINEHSWQT